MFRVRLICLGLGVLSLAACGYSTPMTRTVRDAIPWFADNTDAIELNPNYRYLRVTVRGRVALLVLGYVDPNPEGPIEVWYSREGEVIRLQNGRIVGTAGLETDWRAVRRASVPAWKAMAGYTAVEYRRERDEMPNYRFGIAESVSLYAVPAPSNSKLVRMPAKDLRWFEETVLGQPDRLPSARFALRVTEDEPRVVYAEQCLTREFCLAYQTWPVPK